MKKLFSDGLPRYFQIDIKNSAKNSYYKLRITKSDDYSA